MYSSDTLSNGSLRDRFTDDSLVTASGPKVIVLCFERLVRDLDQALVSMETEDHDTTNTLLRHAQDLLTEMVAMLDVDAWEHAGALLSVYDYVLRRLALANMHKDVAAVVESRRLLSEIGDAFRTASATVSAEAGSDATPTPVVERADAPRSNDRADPGDRPRLSIRA